MPAYEMATLVSSGYGAGGRFGLLGNTPAADRTARNKTPDHRGEVYRVRHGLRNLAEGIF